MTYVITMVAVELFGMDVRAKFVDSRLNSGITIRILVQQDLFLHTFMQYLIAFCSRPKVGSDVISGVVVDPTGVKVLVKFSDPTSNRSPEVQLPHLRHKRPRRQHTPVIT